MYLLGSSFSFFDDLFWFVDTGTLYTMLVAAFVEIELITITFYELIRLFYNGFIFFI